MSRNVRQYYHYTFYNQDLYQNSNFNSIDNFCQTDSDHWDEVYFPNELHGRWHRV